jgi:hypothetical protein
MHFSMSHRCVSFSADLLLHKVVPAEGLMHAADAGPCVVVLPPFCTQCMHLAT